MQNKAFLRGLALVAVSLAAVSSLWGYILITDSSGIYVVKWQTSPVNLQIKLPQATVLSDGNSLSSTVAAAAQVWNAQTGTVQLATTAYGVSPYATHNGANEIAMDSTADGEDFGTGTIAITISYRSSNARTESDIIFNSAYTWDSYRGALHTTPTKVYDIQRVAVHELGHVLGLDHPDEHGQTVTAIMNSTISSVYTLQADDIAGAQKLYGAPGFVPANDNFANATAITLESGTVQLTGSNIAATRETGEPDHSGVAQGHSVWWKWTPLANGIATVDTLGSDYDTVLAVYTGTSVSAITLVTSNDDVDRGVVRTSAVTFNAVSGTTYYVAVDGFGNATNGQVPYTGSIMLNARFSPVSTPASIVSQPSDQTIKAGQTATFGVTAAGYPSPSYQWQRLPVGGGAWAGVSNGGSYGGSTTAALTVSNSMLSMSGDQFRCVVTNSSGTATSDTAKLIVNPSAPTFSISPANQSVEVGMPAHFTVSVAGDPLPTLQWQRLPASGGAWADLADGSAYSGTKTSSVAITGTTLATNGDQFRCVATNLGGVVASNAATLAVTAASGVMRVSAGGNYSLFVRADGSLWATGLNDYGALGDGTTTTRRTPVQVAVGVVAIAAGSSHSLFLKQDGTLWAMGNNESGQLGDGTLVRRLTPIQVATHVVMIGAGTTYSVFIRDDGTLWVTGYDYFDSTGHPQVITQPRQVATDVSAVAAGYTCCLFIRHDRSLWGTGSWKNGQIGDIEFATDYTPGPVYLAANVVAAEAGTALTFFLQTDATLWGIGTNDYGALGAILGVAKSPVKLANSVTAVSSHGLNVLYKADDNSLWGAGFNRYGQLGDGTTVDRIVPVQVATNVSSVAAGFAHSLFTKADGSLWGMGATGYGELGLGLDNQFLSPVIVKSGTVPAPGAPAGLRATKGVTNRFVLLTWSPQAAAAFYEIWRSTTNDISGASRIASNLVAPLYYDINATEEVQYYYWVKATNGTGTSSSSDPDTGFRTHVTPAAIQTQPADVTVVRPGVPASFSVIASGDPVPTFWWQRLPAGGATWLDLKDYTTYSGSTTATLVINATTTAMSGDQFRCVVTNPGATVTSAAAVLTMRLQPGVIAATAVDTRSFYILQDGTVWGAGSGSYGLLGLGSLTVAVPPHYITNDVVMVGAGESLTTLLKSDRSVWAMGSNATGGLGDGTTVARNLPVQVAADAMGVCAGSDNSLFLKVDGSLWAVGGNQSGQLGDGTRVSRTTPVKIASSVAVVSARNGVSVFIKADGSLWGMGENSVGELGDGTVVNRSSPVLIATRVVTVAVGYGYTAFVRSDSSLWLTGYNVCGQLGDGTTVSRASPIQVATGVIAVACGGLHTVFVKSDGSLWGMGANWWKQLKNGAPGINSTPFMIVPSGVVAVTAGEQHTVFVKTDGSMWGMGENTDQQLFSNDSFPDPTQFLAGTVVAPAAPAGATASFETAASCVRLNWQPVLGAMFYEIWRNTASDPSAATRIAAGVPWAISYDYPSASGTYYYWIKAVNQGGPSGFGAAARIDYAYTVPPLPPTFDGNPSAGTMLAGSSTPLTFSVTTSGSLASTIQWQVSADGGSTWSDVFNGGVYSGTTTATLSITRATASMNGYCYRARASNSAARNVPSGSATLTVIPRDYTGTYFGTFASGGHWALVVRTNSAATYIAYLPDRHSAIVASLTVGSDGSFTVNGSEIKPLASAAVSSLALASPEAPVRQPAGTAATYTLAGQITNEGTITGQLTGLGETFTGAVDSATGSAPAGLYTAAALNSASGSSYSIVCASGQAVVVTTTPAAIDGAAGTVNSSGQLTATTSNNATLSLTINASTQKVSASLTPAGSTTPIAFAGFSESYTPAVGGHLVNLSSRAPVGTGDNVLIVGFVITGAAPKPVIIRGVGPALAVAPFNMTGTLPDPLFDLYHAGVVTSHNDNWATAGDPAMVAAAMARVGAFSLPSGSLDSVISTTLNPGVYSAILYGNGATATGVGMVEIYDSTVSLDTTTPRMVNISSRGFVGTGDNVLIGGFVVTGDQPRQVLIRGVGPTLTTLGVTGTVLADPILYLYHSGAVINQNDNWGSAGDGAALSAAATAVGAFALPVGSKDAGLLTALQPGVYSVIVTGVGTATGIALVEVYEVGN